MEVAASAITGELLSRLISFLIKKHSDMTCPEENLQSLQHLLLRVHTVIEEAEGRRITNSRMLVQLQMLVDAMYRGYYVLDAFKYKPFQEFTADGGNVSRNSCSSSFAAPLKRFRAALCDSTSRAMAVHDELPSVLKKLEAAVANMTEFAVLLGGCKQMHKRPYDTYLYIDNFMFSRHVEKQRIINVLLQDDSPVGGVPAVVPVIGAYNVGKKSLVGYACNNDLVLSHFSSILRFNGDDIWRVSHETFLPLKTLVVVEFISDVNDSEWLQFYSATSRLAMGSKVVIISRTEEIARFGTTKPIRLNPLSEEEFVYLFKALAFGSTDPESSPQLASVGIEIAKMLQGLLLAGNALADMLRINHCLKFWLHLQKRLKNSVEHNFSIFGEHPKLLLERNHPTDITMFVSPCKAPLNLMPPRGESSSTGKKQLSQVVAFSELLAGSRTSLPEDNFGIVVWESRIPPFTKYVSNCIGGKHQCAFSSCKRHRTLYK